MKKISLCTFALLLIVAATAFAQPAPELNNGHIHFYPAKGAHTGGGGGSNLVNHGGPVLTNPQVVFIFWGFGTGTSYTSGMQSFRDAGIFNYSRMLTQYGAATAGTSYSPNSGADVFDTSTPPTNVTDADVQAEVLKYFRGNEGAQTIYEVAIPATSYSSSGTSDSCGGPNLAYCAYHGNFTDGANDVKYAILPYPSCSGCQSAGFSDNQNQDHFIVHETREATSDPDLNAWYDRRGNEADDKCAWSPAPFVDSSTGFAYQDEWSNAAGGCVKQ